MSARPIHARLAAGAARGVVYAYRFTLGPVMGGRCRFHPSCSQYALDAFAEHPPLRAFRLTVRRISRCHPLGGSGVDFVPPRAPRDGAPPPDQPTDGEPAHAGPGERTRAR